VKDPLTEESAATSLERDEELAVPESGTAATEVPWRNRRGQFLASIVLTAALSISPGSAIIEAGTGRRRNTELSESDTSDEQPDPALVSEARELFDRGASEFFEDGMHSSFSKALLKFLAAHGRRALAAIAAYLSAGHARPHVVSEALRWLGELHDQSSVRERWAIMQSMLRHPSPQVRDGAVIGFGLLDDPRARSILLEASKQEQVAELSRLIAQVVEQLEATANAAAADRSSRKPLV
jgi:hypothetical protein